jgi:cell division protein FtsI (penicillin-binding protein 3)
VGAIKVGLRLGKTPYYNYISGFGFGSLTGIDLPGETPGLIRRPQKWSQVSLGALSIGQEVSVTPLQLAVAYAAFANGGELVEPALVKEIRTPGGAVLYEHQKRVVRRVLTPGVADRMRKMLLNVVENGTALQADLSSFLLAGKTGTPRRTVNGRYAAQQYNPNFVGLFPGDAPQFVIVVKLTNPRDGRGSFYSASTAAPLTKTVLQAALAARDAALDRHKLASSAGGALAQWPDSAPALGSVHRDDVSAGSVPYVVSLSQRRGGPRAPDVPRAIPDVHGLELRDAVHSLHSAGFHVRLVRGTDGATEPAAGSLAPAGSLVRLFHDF